MLFRAEFTGNTLLDRVQSLIQSAFERAEHRIQLAGFGRTVVASSFPFSIPSDAATVLVIPAPTGRARLVLPNNPKPDTRITIKDAAPVAGAYTLQLFAGGKRRIDREFSREITADYGAVTLLYDGATDAWWIVGGSAVSSSGGAPIFAQTESEFSHTGDTAWQDVPDVALPMEAYKKYYFRFIAHFSHDGSGDPEFGINVPSGFYRIFGSTQRADQDTDFLVNDEDDEFDAGENTVLIEGVVTNGATAGDLQLRCRTDQSSGTVYSHPGTFGVAWEVETITPQVNWVQLDVPEEIQGTGSNSIEGQFYVDFTKFPGANVIAHIDGDFTYSSGMTVTVYEDDNDQIDVVGGTSRVDMTSSETGEAGAKGTAFTRPNDNDRLFKIVCNGSTSDYVQGLTVALEITD